MAAGANWIDHNDDLPFFQNKTSGGLSADSLSFMVSVCGLSELRDLHAKLSCFAYNPPVYDLLISSAFQIQKGASNRCASDCGI